ncbi:MAG: hypothetical protein TREMPRED_002585 [Tremellales sp. Tagirdzhanova-0007]|nr:MAG: hypothetical protein TREMPRED_002585 [Tremellales sp. Tagirdzhanova-0007]
MTTTVAKQALMTMRSLLTLPVRSDRSFLYRLASTASTAGLLSTPTRAPPSSTTFSGKASPRDSHDPPEYPRGLPQTSKFISSSQPRYPMSQATMDAFDGPSRPRLLSDRVGRRDLPPLKNKVPMYIALATLGLGIWATFILYATNAERLASSVLRSVTFQLRNSAEVADLLGRNVKLEDPWWRIGDPWIPGSVNTMQGRVDLKFRIKGTDGAGTVYFTSIRPSQSEAWRIVRYKLTADSGEVLRLEGTGNTT